MNQPPLHSMVCEGWVRHRRFAPTQHQFKQRMCMLWLDLDELPRLFQGHRFWSLNQCNLGSFHRKDHWGDPKQPLKASYQKLAESQTGQTHNGRVCVLTQPRHFGFVFNPVSFAYLFDEQNQLQSIVAHITNTPWFEQCAYVLPASQATPRRNNHGGLRFRFDKSFHISPFNPMSQTHQWVFNQPRSQTSHQQDQATGDHFPGAKLFVHMDNLKQADVCENKQANRVFDATLVLQTKPWTHANLSRCLWAHPGLPARSLANIYWQAAKLRLKRTPFHDHPPDRLTKPMARCPFANTFRQASNGPHTRPPQVATS